MAEVALDGAAAEDNTTADSTVVGGTLIKDNEALDKQGERRW